MVRSRDQSLAEVQAGRPDRATPPDLRSDPYSCRAPRSPPGRRPLAPSLLFRICPPRSILSFLSRMTVRTNEIQASGEDGVGVVVEGRDVITVWTLPDLELAGRQCLAEDCQARGTDEVVFLAVVDQHGSGDAAQITLRDLPEGRQRGRRFRRGPVVRQ